MKRKGIWLAVSVLLILGLLIGGFGCAKTPETTTPTTSTTPATAPEAVKWIGQGWVDPSAPYGLFSAPRYPFTSNIGQGHYWADWIREASNGRLEIEVTPAGSVTPVPDMMYAVRDGTLQFCFQYPAYQIGFMPEASIEQNLPGGYQTVAEGYDLLYNWGLHDEFAKIYDEHNIWHVELMSSTPLGIGASFPMTDLASFKGKKIRATGVLAEYVTLMGATPVALPYLEIYMGMKLGTIDGWLSGLVSLEEVKLKEVTDYWLLNPVPGPGQATLMINQDSLNELPEDLRELIVTYSIHVITSKETTSMEVQWLVGNPPGGVVYNYFPAEEAAWVTEQCVEQIWPAIAEKSTKCAELIEMYKDWMRAFGKIK